jgi:hypothetical protein
MPQKKSRTSTSAENAPKYELKVTLSGLRVWRKLLVRGDMNLGLLHAVLQVAMGWTNSHLHQFIIGRARYSAPMPEEALFLDEPDLDEEDAVLMDVVPRTQMKFVYEYDFGDSWDHRISVVKKHPPDTALDGVAKCLDGAYACPPEDCGGIPGYAELLEIINDPRHAEYESMMEWLGGGFDPTAFDLQKVNKYLKKLKFPRMTESQLAKVLMSRDGFR